MKRILLFSGTFILVTAFFISGGAGLFQHASAQSGLSQRNPGASRPAAGDADLATLLKRMTNRSGEGLTEHRVGAHTIGFDLGDGFQNVMLARQGTDGDPVTECVSSLAEANDFLGRDLETGAPIYSQRRADDDLTRFAGQNGMSVDEFHFYQRLIAEAAAHRAASPNSATLTIVNADGAGEGFNDPTVVSPEGGNTATTRGGQRLALFQFAAGIWGTFLDSNVEIKVSSKFDPQTPCSTAGGVLGAANTLQVWRDFPGAEADGTWYHSAIANKRAGEDLDSETPEIGATFNSNVDNGCLGVGSRFYYGLDNTTPANRINLLIVLLHEMGHGLGFSSFVSGTTGAPFQGFPDGFMLKMFDRTTGKHWTDMTNAERQVSALNNGNVVFDGANVKIASGFMTNGRDAQGRVQLYTPSTFQSGSSISHFDTVDSPNLLMEPNINTGLGLDLDLTPKALRDVGWYRDTNADVEPDTVDAVQLSGNAVIGTPVTISWTNTGGFNKNVTIELSLDGGTTFPTALATNVANSGSFVFTVPNSPTNQARIRVREAGYADPSGSTANFTIGTTFANHTRFDYDGDGKADISVFRPVGGTWYVLNSGSGFTSVPFGAADDQLAPADYDGDGKMDIGVFRASAGTWYWLNSASGTLGSSQFGASGDLPVPVDFDGDGKADIGVFRPADATWYRLNSSNGAFVANQFGLTGDRPTLGDFDGDGKADIAVYRPSSGSWYRLNSGNGSFVGVPFGTAEDLPTVADYDGDGKADIALYRPSSGTWYRLNSSDGSFVGIGFGISTDRPVAADYDGDGKADISVFRVGDGTWYQLRSASGFAATQFGLTGDQPTPGAFGF